jgi:aryl-alcohol dehydrogenase-like predicted oxidoreductase
MNLANIRGTGTVGIRILAGGALSGNQNRHPIADQNVTPIATGKTFTDDVNESSKYSFLVKEGLVKNLVEASIRFAITNSKLNTALIGLSSYDQLEKAIRYTNKGPLPDETMLRITNEWKNTKKYKDVV